MVGYILLALLGAVLRTTLLAIIDTKGIERTTDDVVTNTGKVTNATAADEHDRVLLKVVAFTTDVRGHFFAIGQTNTSDLPECGVRLLGSRCLHSQTHTATLRAVIKVTDLRFELRCLAWFAYELINGRHRSKS